MKTNLNGIQKGLSIMINIKDLSKAQVLHALWHASKARGSFTLEDAQKEVDNQPCLYFDYVAGHIIRCDLSKDEFDERLFDRANGDGAAAKAIENLRRCLASMKKEGDK